MVAGPTPPPSSARLRFFARFGVAPLFSLADDGRLLIMTCISLAFLLLFAGCLDAGAQTTRFPTLLGAPGRGFDRIQLASQVALDTLNEFRALNGAIGIDGTLQALLIGQGILEDANLVANASFSAAVAVAYGPEASFLSLELAKRSVCLFGRPVLSLPSVRKGFVCGAWTRKGNRAVLFVFCSRARLFLLLREKEERAENKYFGVFVSF